MILSAPDIGKQNHRPMSKLNTLELNYTAQKTSK